MTKLFLPCIFFIGAISCQSPLNESKKNIINEIEAIELPYKYSNDIQIELDSSDKPWRFQMAGTDYSFIGNEEKTFENFNIDRPIRESMSDSAFSAHMVDYEVKSAIPYILERSKTEQIVIINEAHHKPKHRVFTTSLLQDLYEQGYKYLGLETLSDSKNEDSTYNERGYPIMSTGTYTMEPQFGNMVRKALEIGYKLFPYDADGNGKPREIGQAKNIQAFMEKHPNEKILIHCGYQHAQEGELKSSWEKAMAGRLLEYTGINPLTINQTFYDNAYNTEYMSPLHQRLELNEPSVLLDSNQLSYLGTENDNGFDIIVFHEKNQYKNERPLWLLSNKKSLHDIKLDSVKLNLPYFVLAYKTGEDIKNAVPVDLLEIQEAKEKVYLALEPGTYTIVIQNIENKAKSFEVDFN